MNPANLQNLAAHARRLSFYNYQMVKEQLGQMSYSLSAELKFKHCRFDFENALIPMEGYPLLDLSLHDENANFPISLRVLARAVEDGKIVGVDTKRLELVATLDVIT